MCSLVLAEIGDHRSRFTYTRAFKADAGSAPITRASGIDRRPHPPHQKQRLAAAGYIWAFSALTPARCTRKL
jgi:hypothetical protein